MYLQILVFVWCITIDSLINYTLFVLCNSISVTSGQCFDGIERLCAIEPRLRFERFSPEAGLEPRTARSVGQYITY